MAWPSLAKETKALMEPNDRPWRIEGEEATTPWVFACPHAGRIYPAPFLAQTYVRAPLLRRSEDAYVDELFAAATNFAPFLIAHVARAYVDVNRAPTELDPAMFDGPLAGEVETTPRVAAGYGVLASIVREGVALYRHLLPPEEAKRRLAEVHAPYHTALSALIERARARYGFAVLIDCHSMPGRKPADIVLGDRFKTSAASGLTTLFEHAFAAQGFTVARNTPYAGGYTTTTYGRPQEGVHALQIEIGRRLYLNEERVTHGPAFAEVKGRVGQALHAVAEADIAVICNGRSLAAE